MKKILLMLLICLTQLSASQHESENNQINVGEETDRVDEIEVEINQNRIINNMILYLHKKNRDTSVVNKGGVCNGLAFLAQYYASIGRENEFYICLESMSSWDGEMESLSNSTRIPLVYHNLDRLFDQWINDISWFQQTYLKIASLPNLEISSQRRRVQQYEMIKGTSESKNIGILLSPIFYSGITAEQLAELLSIWSWYPHTVLEFGGSRHATSARVLDDGSIAYYDPNIPYRLKPFNYTMDLTRIIQEFKYKLLGFSSDKMDLQLMTYQYVEENTPPVIPEAIEFIKKGKTGVNSPNGFTPLHLAIYANDYDYFLTLLEKENCNPNKEDKLGISPLYLATVMWKHDYVLALLNHPKIKVNNKNRLSPLMAAFLNFNIDAAESLLIKGADIFVTSLEKQGVYELLEKDNNTKLLSIPAVILCCMQKEELEFVRELCQRVPEILNRKDERGATLLDYAVSINNQDLYKLLISLRR